MEFTVQDLPLSLNLEDRLNKYFFTLYMKCLEMKKEDEPLVLMDLIQFSQSGRYNDFDTDLKSILFIVLQHQEKFSKIATPGEDPQSRKKFMEEVFKKATELQGSSLMSIGELRGAEYPSQYGFNYSSWVNRPLPGKKRVKEKSPHKPTAIKEIDPDFPLKEKAEAFFEEKKVPYEKEAVFALDFELKPRSALGQSLLQDLTTGHTANCKKESSFYPLKEEKTLDGLEEELTTFIEGGEKAAQKSLAQIVEDANFLLEGSEVAVQAGVLVHSDAIQLQRYWGKKATLSFQKHLLPAFLMGDTAYLKKQNPHLSDEMLQAIFNQITDHMILSSRIDQAKEAVKKISAWKESKEPAEKANIFRQIGEILHKKRGFNPLEHPLFLLYEYASGHILRPEQSALLLRIINETDDHQRKELLIEFQAGGGKTKVLSAILIILAIKKGKLPIFYSLPSLQDITKEDLKFALNEIFGRKLAVLEINLTTTLHYWELEKIYEDLVHWREEGVTLLLTPEAYHALYLNYQFALKKKDKECIKNLSKIRIFLKEHGFFIIDEAHRNAQSLWQANITCGNASSLPKDEQNLFVICYKALVGNIPLPLTIGDDRLLHVVLGICDLEQSRVDPRDTPEIFGALASYLASLPEMEIPLEHRVEVAHYLCNKNAPMPQFVTNLYESDLKRQAELLFLARGLLTEILPITLAMVGNYDHGPSTTSSEDVDAPWVNKDPTSFKFEVAEIAAALSNQGLYQRGLATHQMEKLCLKLLEDHKASLGTNISSEELLFNQWKRSAREDIALQFDEINPSNRSQMQQLALAIGKNPDVVERYLKYHLLSQVKIFAIKLTSTALDLVSGGESSILLSATMGKAEEYPDRTPSAQTESDVVMFDDFAFQAAVLQRALTAPANEKLFWLDPQTPKKLFEELFKEDAQFFNNLEGMINVGGWYGEFTTLELAEEFLDFAETKGEHYDGAIAIRESKGLMSGKQEIVFIGQKKEGKREYLPLAGSDLYPELKKLGIKAPETLKLFKVYGPMQCTGTDLTLTPTAKMLLLFSETTSLWFMVQGIMRLRQFIKPLQNFEEVMQSIVWIGPTKLKAKIRNAELGPKSVALWSLEKEADSMEDRIIARAFQQLAFEIRRLVDKKTLFSTDPDDQIRDYKIHKEVFEEKIVRNLYDLYANPESDQETGKVLAAFFAHFLTESKLSPADLKELEFDENQIQDIIANTVALVPTIRQKRAYTATSTTHNVGQERAEHVGAHQAKAQEKGHHYNELMPKKPHHYAEEELAISSTQLTNYEKLASNFLPLSLNALFNTSVFLEEIYLLPNTYETVDERKFLKPLEYFLLVIDKESGTKTVLVASRLDAEIYRQQLADGKGSPNKQIALFTANGGLAQNAKGESRLLERIDRAWMQRVCLEIAFANGQVYDSEAFNELMPIWLEADPHFEEVWSHILLIQGNPESVSKALVETALFRAQRTNAAKAAGLPKVVGESIERPAPPAIPARAPPTRVRQPKASNPLPAPTIKTPTPTRVLPITGVLLIITAFVAALIGGGTAASLYYFLSLKTIYVISIAGGSGGVSLLIFLAGSVSNAVYFFKR